jgi:hypothetical protein
MLQMTDYQYDITFGGVGLQVTLLLNGSRLLIKLKMDQYLTSNGHIPGQLLFAVNDHYFTEETFGIWWTTIFR